MVVETKKKKRLRQLEKRAKEYFTKKIELRLLRISFGALKKHYQVEQFTKSGRADLVAAHHYFIKVGRK